MNNNLVPLISETEVAAAVKRLAQALDQDYANHPPVLLGVLKGSFVFLADLARAMQVPIANIEFIRLSSYGATTISSGEAALLAGVKPEWVSGKDIVLVEDIIDTGISTTTAIKYLQEYQPASIKICALLDKPDRRKVPVKIDYLGITVPDRFIVGYGIDFNEQYRQLPAIYTLPE